METPSDSPQTAAPFMSDDGDNDDEFNSALADDAYDDAYM